MGNSISCDESSCSNPATEDFEKALLVCSTEGCSDIPADSPNIFSNPATSFSTMNPDEVALRLVTRPLLLDKFLHTTPYGPFDIDFQNEAGDTALHLACRAGIVQSCKLLVKYGAAFLPNKAGDFPSQVAAKANHLDCKVFLEHKEELYIRTYPQRDSPVVGPRDENSPAPTKTGLLMLRHTLRSEKWEYKERFFVLTDENLYFFETEEEWNLKGEGGKRGMVHISGCQVAVETMATDDCTQCFRVADGQRAHVYHLGSTSLEVRTAWIDAILLIKETHEAAQQKRSEAENNEMSHPASPHSSQMSPSGSPRASSFGKSLSFMQRIGSVGLVVGSAGSLAMSKASTAAMLSSPGRAGSFPPRGETGGEKEERKPDLGVGETEVYVLYYHTAEQEGCPFPPDSRREFSLIKGEKLIMMDIRDDGYCIVRYPRTQLQGFCPGNYISVDGKRGIVENDVKIGGSSRGPKPPGRPKF